MRAGDLRHRVTLQSKSTTQNGFGEELDTWVDDVTVWGQVEPLSAREYVEQQRVEAEVTHRIRLRYRPGVTPDQQVIFAGRVFAIESVINAQERQRELVLVCRELVR